ncbi:MAG: hypothetical protein J2P22_04450 [Nocardioides sp.]|nr:hypothetical protein [Nocardioides sp.]
MSRPRTCQVREAAVVASVVAGFAVLHRLGTSYGATHEERRSMLPGDDIVRHPQTVATHARTIDAPPEAVWPWLVQVGWHRAGWYTPRWVDVLLFPDNLPSAPRLLEGFSHLAVGDFVPDGPPVSECGFVVRDVSPGRRLVLHSTTHLPLSWRRRGRRVSWTWTFVLSPVAGGRATRLVFRWRARTYPWWLTAGVHAAIVPADLVMSRAMLRGLARRATSHTGRAPRLTTTGQEVGIRQPTGVEQ